MKKNKKQRCSFVALSFILLTGVLLSACSAGRDTALPGSSTASLPPSSVPSVSAPNSSEQESSAAPSSIENIPPASSEKATASSMPESESEASSSSSSSSEEESTSETPASSIIELPEQAAVPFSPRPATTKVLEPYAGGVSVYTGGSVTLDTSNSSEGYIMLQYSGDNAKVKVRITKNGGTVYTYNLHSRSQYEVYPLTEGSGSYLISVFENVSGNQYSQAFGETIEVSLADAFRPFLYPNHYVRFSTGSAAVAKGAELSALADSDAGAVQQIYNYVINNISYDYAKASSVTSGYVPNPDDTLNTKKGICFDYASLMTAMLRSQGIPAKLVVGYTGELYHAWINVYLAEVGWVDNLIYFDGKSWTLMDPTFASSQKNYVGDSANYQAKFTY